MNVCFTWPFGHVLFSILAVCKWGLTKLMSHHLKVTSTNTNSKDKNCCNIVAKYIFSSLKYELRLIQISCYNKPTFIIVLNCNSPVFSIMLDISICSTVYFDSINDDSNGEICITQRLKVSPVTSFKTELCKYILHSRFRILHKSNFFWRSKQIQLMQG